MTTYYTNPDLITSLITAGGMSDHEIVINIVDMKAKTTKKKPRRVYIYKNGNIENIREDMLKCRRELEKDITKSADKCTTHLSKLFERQLKNIYRTGH